MSNEVKVADTLVSAKGGTLDIVRDGEVVASVAVPPGAHLAREFIAFLPPDCEVQVGEGLAVFAAKTGYHLQRYGKGSHDSGANPDFEPTSASRVQAQLEQGFKRIAAAENRVDAKLKALKAVQVIPTATPEKPAEKLAEKPEEPVVE